MKNISINEKEARDLYKVATLEIKSKLENSFGKSFFYENIMDKIKTYEDACEVLGIHPINEQKLKEAGATESAIVLMIIETIAKALNEGWEPDWDNGDQIKYYPWFNLSGGFAFFSSDYYYSFAYAGSGSRFCFKSGELAEYAGKQFLNYYEKIIK